MVHPLLAVLGFGVLKKVMLYLAASVRFSFAAKANMRRYFAQNLPLPYDHAQRYGWARIYRHMLRFNAKFIEDPKTRADVQESLKTMLRYFFSAQDG
jgi:hypothetical protein